MPIPRHEKSIAPRDAFRAIYIDLEGFTDEPPALLGLACEFEFQQVVLHEPLRPAASAKDLRVRSLSR